MHYDEYFSNVFLNICNIAILNTWQKRKLGELGHLQIVSIDPQSSPEEVFNVYSMPAYDNCETPELIKGGDISSNKLLIDNPTLLINKLNVHQRRIWNVTEHRQHMVSSSELLPFKTDQLDLGFLRQYLLSDKVTSDLIRLSSGTSNSQKRITPNDLKNYVIFKPSKLEQVSIGKIVNVLENLIAVNQRKVDLLKRAKKTLLQNMFV